MVNLIEKASIKAQPGKYNKLRDSCVKLQAILDRKKLHKRMSKVSNYLEELSFYTLIVPGLPKKIDDNLPEKTKLYLLELHIEEWIQKNVKQCSQFIKVFDKKNLPVRKVSSPRGKTSTLRSSIRAKSTLDF